MSKPLIWVGVVAGVTGILAITMAKPVLATVSAFALVAGGVFLSLVALLRARNRWRARANAAGILVAGLIAAVGVVGLGIVLLFYDMGFDHPLSERADGEFVVKSWTRRGIDAHRGTFRSLFFRGTLVTDRLSDYSRHPTRQNLVIVTSHATDDIIHDTHVFDGDTSRLLRIGPLTTLPDGAKGWSPDGNRLVIEIRDVLYLLDIEAWQAGPLADLELEPHTVFLRGWSPNSRRFAVTDHGPRSKRSDWSTLLELDAETRAARVVGCIPQLPRRPTWQDQDFTWRDNVLIALAAESRATCP